MAAQPEPVKFAPTASVASVSDEAASTLAPFFARLQSLEEGKAEQLRILQLGDSHTAGDYLSGRLRQLFQQKFGDAGRGMMVAGYPFSGLRQDEVKVTHSGHWSYFNSFQATAPGPFGITGFRAESRSINAELTLTVVAEAGFERAAIEVVRRPEGGKLEAWVDGKLLQRIDTADAATQVARIALSVPPGSRQLRLVAIDKRPVALLSWTVERKSRGLVFDSHGVSGATIEIIGRWTPEIVQQEIRERDPALVILAYGTNEGFQSEFDEAKYAQSFAAQLSFLRQAAPHAAWLIIGPPDGDHRPPQCARLHAAQSTPCLISPATPAPAACIWRPAAGLPGVRETQQRAAAAVGAFFWDWSQLMGGACGMHAWTLLTPPLGRPDHVHFTAAGYEASADALFNRLMAGYRAFKAASSAAKHPPS